MRISILDQYVSGWKVLDLDAGREVYCLWADDVANEYETYVKDDEECVVFGADGLALREVRHGKLLLVSPDENRSIFVRDNTLALVAQRDVKIERQRAELARLNAKTKGLKTANKRLRTRLEQLDNGLSPLRLDEV